MTPSSPSARQHADVLLRLARASVKDSGQASVARLQRELGLGHSISAALIDCLAEEGTLQTAYGTRPLRLHPRYVAQNVRDVSQSPRTRYVNRLVALALFFFECHEEGHCGHSKIPGLLSPVPAVTCTTLRDLFLTRWFGHDKLLLTEAALAFHAWLTECGYVTFDDGGMLEAIMVACAEHERVPLTGLLPAQIVDRSHLRLARCYRHMLSDGVGAHSRVFEWYVAGDLVPRGASSERQLHGAGAGSHAEHVVPCAFVRDTALRWLEQGRPLEDVVLMTKRCLVVVNITEEQRSMLDDGPDSLRDSMPQGWDIGTGCVYERLHDKGITFTPASAVDCVCQYPAPQPA